MLLIPPPERSRTRSGSWRSATTSFLARGWRLVVESATGSFAAGQASMLDVLGAARDLRDVHLEQIAARSRLGAAWASLRREIGDVAVARAR